VRNPTSTLLDTPFKNIPPPKSILPSNTLDTACPQSSKFTISCNTTRKGKSQIGFSREFEMSIENVAALHNCFWVSTWDACPKGAVTKGRLGSSLSVWIKSYMKAR
jgi:hypothetical protein